MSPKAFVFVLILGVVAAAGCSRPQATVSTPTPTPTVTASVDGTEALPGGGVRSTATKEGLRLTAEVASTTVKSAPGLSVRIVLTNVGQVPIHWDELSLGWDAAITGGPFSGTSHGIHYWGRQAKPGLPFSLAPGESTSTISAMSSAPHGLYRVRPGYEGFGGPSGAAPEILVRVMRR